MWTLFVTEEYNLWSQACPTAAGAGKVPTGASNMKSKAGFISRNRGAASDRRKRRFPALVMILAASVMAVCPVHADYDKGVQAWESGQYREAVSEWMSSADAGDGRAMLEIGRAHLQGLGVLQDFVEAHKWFNLAASRGAEGALEERDALGERMTADERAEAQKLARQWRPGGGATESAAAGTRTPSATPKPPPEAIREAQALLKGLGYRPGPTDGVWGPRTGNAYRAFLRDSGMPPGEMLELDALLAMRKIAGEKGVTVQIDTSAGSTRTAQSSDILHHAARAGDIAGLEAALDAGSDVDRLDGQGWTALMHAVNRGNLLIVESLTGADADVDIRAPDGATALFMAAVLGQPEIVEILMKAGADISVPGPKGRTAVDVARLTFGEPDVVEKSGVAMEVVRLVHGVTMEEPLYAVGTSFWDCEACPEMVVVPAGSFMMGSPGSEAGRYDDEGPVHRVEIPYRFAVGKFEVAFREWDACVSDGGCSHRPDDEGWGRGSRPVIRVSWDDAREYVDWLSRRTGEEYRLLSESEWEYVARAGTTTAYHFGTGISPGQANYDLNFWKTVPVGSYPPNDFGLHDVHGNVYEWVEDCYHDSYEGAPSEGNAWVAGECNYRVLRGGSWVSESRYLRSAYRNRDISGNRNLKYGFRVARTLTP